MSAYDDWINQIATQYATNPTLADTGVNSSIFGYSPSGTQSQLNNPAAVSQLAQGLKGQPTLANLFAQGITPDQITGAGNTAVQSDAQLLQQLNSWNDSDQSGPMPQNLQDAIATGHFIGPSDSGNSYSLNPQTSAGGQQADTLATQGLADFNPMAAYKDHNPNAFGYDPQTQGLVQAATNQNLGSKLQDAVYFGLPAAAIGGLFAAGLGPAAGGLLTDAGDGAAASSIISPNALASLPSAIGNASQSSNPGAGIATSLLGALAPGLGAAAGAPSWLSSLLPSAVGAVSSLTQGAGINPIAGATTLARLLSGMVRQSPNGP